MQHKLNDHGTSKQNKNCTLREESDKQVVIRANGCDTTNVSQPDLNSLLKIADLLEVDIKELIVREYKSYLLSQESSKK